MGKMLLDTARVLLIALTFVGGYCLHAFGHANGFFGTLTKLTEAATLYDSTIYDPVFTGIGGLDDILAVLLSFFWPVCDGKTSHLAAHCILFGGQFVAAWTITILEGRRRGNSWRIASFTTLAGLLVQSMGAALILPAFLALQLLTNSATTLASTTLELHSVPESDLLALPYSLVLGYILPTIVMSLSSPKILTLQAKIYAILFWQFFPLWVQIFQTVLTRTVFVSTSSRVTSRVRQIKLHGRVYLFAFYIAAAVHLAGVGMSVATSFMLWKSGDIGANKLNLTGFYVPPNPFSQKQASDVPEGAFWFIQFDYLISSIAYLVWSIGMRYGGSEEKHRFGLRPIIDLIVSLLIVGPIATALTLIWERDDNIMYGDKLRQTRQAEDKKIK